MAELTRMNFDVIRRMAPKWALVEVAESDLEVARGDLRAARQKLIFAAKGLDVAEEREAHRRTLMALAAVDDALEAISG